MHGCDESKCVSRGRSSLYNYSFTCYGDDGTFYPLMCADGFLPMIAEDEPPYIAAAWWGINSTVSYFSCCPPQHTTPNTTAIDVTVTRHCSDPITPPIDLEAKIDESADAICELQDTRKYSRRMKPLGWWDGPDSFLCCDSTPTIGHIDEINSNITTTATDFLDDVDCLPYCDEYYSASTIENYFGEIHVNYCDFPEGPEGHFVIPRSINASSGTYQCCKDGRALPFVRDLAFKTTLYPLIALYSVAAILSAVVAIGLLIPLLIQLKDGSFHQRRSTRRRGQASRYSTYNLYLVYLALADLVFCLLQIALYGTTINQTYDSRFYPAFVVPPQWDDISLEVTLAISYQCTNFYINAVICYEVLFLLRASRRAQRITQPSLTKVNLQVGAAFIMGTITAVSMYFLIYGETNAYMNENWEKGAMLSRIFWPVYYILVGLPFLYSCYVTFLIWLRGYIPSVNGATASDRAMRELTIYFCRIIMVFIVIWIPVHLLQRWGAWFESSWVTVVIFWLLAIQPILTFCMILTKTDARKYIWDLVTLSYLKDKALPVGATKNTGSQKSSRRPTGAITGVTDNIADSGAYDNADDVADDNADDNADDGAADDIDANADIDAAI